MCGRVAFVQISIHSSRCLRRWYVNIYRHQKCSQLSTFVGAFKITSLHTYLGGCGMVGYMVNAKAISVQCAYDYCILDTRDTHWNARAGYGATGCGASHKMHKFQMHISTHLHRCQLPTLSDDIIVSFVFRMQKAMFERRTSRHCMPLQMISSCCNVNGGPSNRITPSGFALLCDESCMIIWQFWCSYCVRASVSASVSVCVEQCADAESVNGIRSMHANDSRVSWTN